MSFTVEKGAASAVPNPPVPRTVDIVRLDHHCSRCGLQPLRFTAHAVARRSSPIAMIEASGLTLRPGYPHLDRPSQTNVQTGYQPKQTGAGTQVSQIE